MRLPCYLRRIRGARSLRDIENESGVHRGTLSGLERGQELPLEKHIPALERAYGAEVHFWYPPFVLAAISRDVDEEHAA
jgi:transcriptional regulator with XRE-family HTH domain